MEKQNNNPEIELEFQYGTMTKDPMYMLPEELLEWQNKIKVETRRFLFSIGQPLVSLRENVIIVEYPDGRITKEELGEKWNYLTKKP